MTKRTSKMLPMPKARVKPARGKRWAGNPTGEAKLPALEVSRDVREIADPARFEQRLMTCYGILFQEMVRQQIAQTEAH